MGERGRTIDVATANIQDSLGAAAALSALNAVLALEPDLVGLQEWYPTRLRVLSRTGPVRLVLPGVTGWVGKAPATASTPGYLWNAPLLGGCAVGARADRFEPVSCRTRLLSAPGLTDRGRRRRGPEPGRAATVTVHRDLHVDRTVCLVNFHLVSGVQSGGRYRQERPALVTRHRHEADALTALVREQLALGHVVHATGDSNFDGFRIDGLTSAWEGRTHHPGTLGPRRKVDDVHGPGPAERVTVVTTGSDHAALVVRRPDPGVG